MIPTWIILSGLAAITFGLGDFIVVLSGKKIMDIVLMYIVYCIIIGILNLIYLMGIRTNGINDILKFGYIEWIAILLFSGLYFIAYLTHFMALTRAPNAGLANALVMFHVVILTFLAYVVLNQPLNWQTLVGIIITFIGATIITLYSGI
jgi:drug/metabolite transporter (DMT)-like permease